MEKRDENIMNKRLEKFLSFFLFCLERIPEHYSYGYFHCITATIILVYRSNETAAILGDQTNSLVETSLVPKKFYVIQWRV